MSRVAKNPVALPKGVTATVDGADWVMFAKNGADVTSMAVMLARGYRKRAKIVLAEPVDGQTHVEGRLQGMDGDEVLVAVGTDKIRRIPSGRIARARLAVEF